MMHEYPYTNFHDLNADWIVDQLGDLKDSKEAAAASAESAAESATAAANSEAAAAASEESAQINAEMIQSAADQLEMLNARVENLVSANTGTRINTVRATSISPVDGTATATFNVPEGYGILEALTKVHGTAVWTTGCGINEANNVITLTISTTAITDFMLIYSSVEAVPNAEVIDGRVGYDGTTYPSIGDAIRGQVRAVNLDLNDAVEKIEEHRIRVDFEEGSYTVSNGVLTESNTAYSKANYRRAKPVKVTAYSQFIITNSTIQGYIHFSEDGNTYTSYNWLTSGSRKFMPLVDGWVAFSLTATSGNSIPTLQQCHDGLYIRPPFITWNSFELNRNNSDLSLAESINPFGSYIIGSALNGTLNINNANRIVFVNHFKFSIDINIKVQNGFRAGIELFENGVFVTDKGWNTGTYLMRANTEFLLVVSRSTEQTETDPEWWINFVKAITFEPYSEGGSIPDYLINEYKNTLQTVQSLADPVTFSFGFMSDMHFSEKGSGYNEDLLRTPIINAVNCLQKMSKEYPLSLVAFGGDYMQFPTIADGMTKQSGINNLMEVNAWASGMDCPHVVIAGNHEQGYRNGNADNVGTTDYGLTYDEIYDFIGKKNIRFEIKKASNNVFFMKDDLNNVFYLILSTFGASYSSASITTGISNAMNENTENYPLICINHFGIENGTVYAGVKTVIDSLIDNYNQTIIAWISGHVHSDWSAVYRNVLVISCLQSGHWSSTPSQDGNTYNHTQNTESESAFSIFTVNKTTGKLYCTRFGAGVDREFNYNDTSGDIGIVN